MTDNNIEEAFKVFDLNGDGYIDLDEFRRTLPNLRPTKTLKKIKMKPSKKQSDQVRQQNY